MPLSGDGRGGHEGKTKKMGLLWAQVWLAQSLKWFDSSLKGVLYDLSGAHRARII